MAFFLTPRFVPAQRCSPFACAPSRPIYRRPAPAAVPSFVPFLNQVEELLGEIDREARRAAHAQRQQRKRVFRARFDVRENNNGYEVEGELPGFEQENISIEVTDEYTLKVGGKQANEAQEGQQAQPEASAPAAAITEAQNTTETTNDKLDGVTLAEPEVDAHSDTSSHKSYQPTVEDDFEDLGAETSSTVSASSSPAPTEPKGKEKAVEPVQETSAPATQQQQPQDQELLSERVYGSFERNFRFPERIDAEGVRASLKNGVLSIKVPKAPVPAIRSITIQ